jgi:hypothetical protein
MKEFNNNFPRFPLGEAGVATVNVFLLYNWSPVTEQSSATQNELYDQ